MGASFIKMAKLAILLVIFFFIDSISFADVIYLKDGVRLEGKILKEGENEVLVELEINGKYVPVKFNFGEISKIIKTEISEIDKKKSPEVLLMTANSVFTKGELDKAIAYYEMSILKKPDYADAFRGLGNIYLKLNKPEKAKENFRKALFLYSNLSDPPYYTLAILNLELGNVKQAEECFRESMTKEGNFINSAFSLGKIYFNNKQYNVAYYYFNKALFNIKDKETAKMIKDWLEKPELAEYRKDTESNSYQESFPK